ncbi:hypothetical protein HanIR_Chr03g0109251 [Helianthus annuus]|nr:hypothetical protein HanIR_Chr03g0109251 [Helianthus annuus]
MLGFCKIGVFINQKEHGGRVGVTVEGLVWWWCSWCGGGDGSAMVVQWGCGGGYW